ncbi:hypothetical protein FHQ26_00585 [Testudinibacter sp. TR-2022]|uniref:TrbI F-type domain-containing protein n=1 Tax=Testudinibacter sp. TR-2022 TaxID=2585029 RepID=UPI00111A0F3B|nr:TrbI F-type domain-containing protein [Testudinibacter sp. TR-2022]TNH04044.1 hypothetical protein FHQ22_05855 [Pasteurellaceae bacterium Phil31]TNH10171.1 hypothetical protein FHQ25_06120 [Testudinibacter sp. TR-2022]TNH13031.1 hypothetical protein FHQ26_00585 [Testudinibacter sp. TR-2022]
MRNKITVSILILIAILSAVGATFQALSYYRQPKLVTFDMKGVTDTFLKQVANRNLPEEDNRKLIARYERELANTIDEYSQEQRVIVLVKGAVVTPVDDKTAEIKKRLAQRMRNE